MIKLKNKFKWWLVGLIAISLIVTIVIFWSFWQKNPPVEELFKQAFINNFQTRQISFNFFNCSSDSITADCQADSTILEGFDFSKQDYFLEIKHPIGSLLNYDKMEAFKEFQQANHLEDLSINFKIYQPLSGQNFIQFQLISTPPIDNLAERMKELGLINSDQQSILDGGWLPEIKKQDIDQNLNLANFMNNQNPVLFGFFLPENRNRLTDLIESVYQPNYLTVRQFTDESGAEIYEYDVTIDWQQFKQLRKKYNQLLGLKDDQSQLENEPAITVRINAGSRRIIGYDQKIYIEGRPTYIRRQVVGLDDNLPWDIQTKTKVEPQHFYQIVAKLYNIDEEDAKLEFPIQ